MTHTTANIPAYVPAMTYTKARAACRALGYPLRKETPGSDDLALYRVGSGVDAPHAYFTTCPDDALATCKAMAAPKVTVSTTPAPGLGCMGLPNTPTLPRPSNVGQLKSLAALRKEAAQEGLAGELARSGLSVATCGNEGAAMQSGGFPLYAFKTGHGISADDLDAMAYGPAHAGLI